MVFSRSNCVSFSIVLRRDWMQVLFSVMVFTSLLLDVMSFIASNIEHVHRFFIIRCFDDAIFWWLVNGRNLVMNDAAPALPPTTSTLRPKKAFTARESLNGVAKFIKRVRNSFTVFESVHCVRRCSCVQKHMWCKKTFTLYERTAFTVTCSNILVYSCVVCSSITICHFHDKFVML